MGSKKNTNLRNTYLLRIQISIMSIILALVFLCLVSSSIADCEYDSNPPCECTNPFVGTDTHFLGDPKRNCASAKACYVKNISGCKDIKQSKGGNRCQSNLACEPSEPAPPKPTDALQLNVVVRSANVRIKLLHVMNVKWTVMLT